MLHVLSENERQERYLFMFSFTRWFILYDIVWEALAERKHRQLHSEAAGLDTKMQPEQTNL